MYQMCKIERNGDVGKNGGDNFLMSCRLWLHQICLSNFVIVLEHGIRFGSSSWLNLIDSLMHDRFGGTYHHCK